MRPSAQPCHNVRDYSATGDGTTLNTSAINRAIADCHQAGGGTVFFPAGTYLSGTIELLGNVTLNLDAGAVILGSPRLEDYRTLPFSSELRNSALLFADGAANIAITGRGTIDGNADAFAIYDAADTWRDFDATRTRQGEAYLAVNDLPDDGPVKHRPRPGMLILLLRCRDIVVRDIKLVGAPNWGLHVACSERVLITGLDIRSSLLLPNSSGLDVSLSRNVRISDCNIEAGDDAIAFSPCADGFGGGVAENITVENCVLLARSAAIRIGWGAHDFRNLLFNNIVIRESNRGILINLRYGERMENLVFSNIVIGTRLYKGKWWGKGEPIHISALAELEGEKRPRVLRNVTFTNITATGDHGIVLYADDGSTIEDVTFDRVRVTVQPGPLQESFGGNFDLRPVWDPARRVFAHDIPAFFARGVTRLSLRNFSVRWAEGLPEFCRHAVELEHFDDVTIDGFRGRQTRVDRAETDAAIVLRDGRDITVRNSKLTAGGGRLVAAERVTNCSLEG
ncbi:MAG: hypothetical protein JWM35_2253 [Verrucomicrobia bacterium]|nr:hypothetical protein [Verrucomicrobiota bacterium]